MSSSAAQELERAQLLREVPERRGLDLPEAELRPVGVRRREGGDGVAVAMAGDPEDQVRIGVQLREQVLLRAEGARAPRHRMGRLLDADRTVRGDDHEHAVGLAAVQLADEPVVPLLVQRDVPVAVVVGVVVALRVVQREDPDRYAGLGLEGVAGEAGVDGGRVEAVSLQLRGGREELAHPLALRQRATVGVGGEDLRRRLRSRRPARCRRCRRRASARRRSPCRSRGLPGRADPRRRCRGRGSPRRRRSCGGSRRP